MAMTVTSTTAAASAPTSTPKSKTLDYDAFLHLLIAQMKAQDPMNPADTATYMGQLAAFSGVEQNVKTNAKLDALMTSIAFTQAGSLIGHQVTSADGAVSGKATTIEIHADGTQVVLEGGTRIKLEPGVTIS